MPQYKVKKGQKGFYNGRIYDSEGKRPILVTDEPIKGKLPSWLIPLTEEVQSTAAAKQAQADIKVAQAKLAEEDAKKAVKEAEAAKHAADKDAESEIPPAPPVNDKVEKDAVTFTEAPKSTQVETL